MSENTPSEKPADDAGLPSRASLESVRDDRSDLTDHSPSIPPIPPGVSPELVEEDQKTVISHRPPLVSPGASWSSSFDAVRALEGEWLGHFKLDQFVGGGGMGAVFRAADSMLGRTVAVKVLAQSQSSDEETVRRFKNEAQSAARLDHANIARVYYVGEDKGWNYIVFEYIEGENIRDLVERRGQLPIEEAVSYVLQIAEALRHASERDVVHRDIKPSNVLVNATGQAKLVDMGLARLHQVETSENDLTASGVTLGTFDYISPEQARDPRCTDVRSDLYSLGCTFYYMVTGRPPFPHGTVLQKLLSHSTDTPPDPAGENPSIPAEITAVIHKLLAKQPTDRYQLPSELSGELLLLSERFEWDMRGIEGTVWVSSAQSRWAVIEHHLPWLVSVTALVIIAFSLDFFWASHSATADQIPKLKLPESVSSTSTQPSD